MKILCILSSVFLLAGCASSHRSTSLTADQARTLAIQLANEKALTLYRCQPFRDGRPAKFVAGRWVWADARGYGHGDLQATVELAADGSTHSVDLKLLESQNLF